MRGVSNLLVSCAILIWPSLVLANEQIEQDLLGRAIGAQVSYERECEGKSFPSAGTGEVYLRLFVTWMSEYMEELSAAERKEFFNEFFYSSIVTYKDCNEAKSEIESYWNALSKRGVDKDDVGRILKNTERFRDNR